MKSYIDISADREDKYIHFFDKNKYADLYFVQLGHHATSKNYYYGPMTRDHYLIHFIKSGKGFFTIHNKKHQLKEGLCFLIEPKQIAYYESDSEDPLEYYWIGFGGHHATSYVNQMNFSLKKPLREIGSMQAIFEEFHRIDKLGYNEDYILAYQGTLYFIIFYLIQSAKTIPSNTSFTYINTSKLSSEDYVQKVIDIVEASYNTPIFIDQISDTLGLSRSYLSKIFKEQTGLSIKQYIIDFRLNKASILLKNHELTIHQISLEIGLKDPLYFSRIFHKHYGMSPSEYRLQF